MEMDAIEKINREKYKAIFLDRDGTINVEKNYLYRIEDFEFIPGVFEGLRLLRKAGFLLIIITNQSGIARGYYKEEEFQQLNKWMLCELKKNNIDIASVYYCPHHINGKVEKYRKDCDCRKPKLGMYMKAIEDYNIDLSHSYCIGDKIRDSEICLNTDCQGYLIANNEKENVRMDVMRGVYPHIKYAEDLLSAAKEIISQR